jgi:hypothetical protein
MKVWSLAKYTSWKSMSPGFRPSRASESAEEALLIDEGDEYL